MKKNRSTRTMRLAAFALLLLMLQSLPSTAGIGGSAKSLNAPEAPTIAVEDTFEPEQNHDGSTLGWHQVLIRVITGMLLF